LKTPRIPVAGGGVDNGQAKAAHQTCQNITAHLAEVTEFESFVSQLNC